MTVFPCCVNHCPTCESQLFCSQWSVKLLWSYLRWIWCVYCRFSLQQPGTVHVCPSWVTQLGYKFNLMPSNVYRFLSSKCGIVLIWLISLYTKLNSAVITLSENLLLLFLFLLTITSGFSSHKDTEKAFCRTASQWDCKKKYLVFSKVIKLHKSNYGNRKFLSSGTSRDVYPCS